MPISDEELIDILTKEDKELQALVEQHRNLDKIINELDEKKFLTTQEVMDKKRLQKIKLNNKDKIAKILNEYRKNRRVIF